MVTVKLHHWKVIEPSCTYPNLAPRPSYIYIRFNVWCELVATCKFLNTNQLSGCHYMHDTSLQLMMEDWEQMGEHITCYVCMSLDTKLLVNLSLPASCNGHLAATGLLFSWHIQLLADSDSQRSAAQIMRELANLGTQCKKKKAKPTEHATYPTEHTTRLHSQAWPDCVWVSSRGTHLYVASWTICDSEALDCMSQIIAGCSWSAWFAGFYRSEITLISCLALKKGSEHLIKFWSRSQMLQHPCFLKLYYYLVGVASDLPVASDSQLHFAAVYNETRMVRHY